MTVYGYLYYIFQAQGNLYEAPLGLSSFVEKVTKHDRNVLCSYQLIIYPHQNADYRFSDW